MASTASARKKPPSRPRDLVVEALLVVGVAIELLLVVALVVQGPNPGTSTNLVGVVGRFLASALYTLFGVVSFALLALALYVNVLALVRKTVEGVRWRLVGVALLVAGACALVHQLLPTGVTTAAGGRPLGIAPGGWLGEIVYGGLKFPFGTFGAFVFSVILLCTGFAFATDWLLYEMAFDGLRKLAGAGALLSRFWPKPPTPSLAGASAATAKKSAKPEKSTPPQDLELSAAPAAAVAVLDEEDAAPEEADAPAEVGGVDDVDVAFLDEEILVPAELVPPRLPGEDKPAAKAAAVVGDDAPLEPDPDAPPAPPKPVLRVKLEEPRREPREKPAAPKVERPRGDGEYEFPSAQLLDRPKPRNLKQLEAAIQTNAEVLQKTLAEFKVEGQVVAFQQGPVVTMLEVALAPGTKVTKIHSLADDLAMALKAESVRIVAPIPGKSTVGVEIPNPIRDDVRMLSILEAQEFKDSKAAIPLLLGAAADGKPIVEDLASMPHLLIAGSTGSGKSVCINTILLSILMTRTPDEVRLILVDPKQVELSFFAEIPHLLAPVVTDMKRASQVLEWALDKMEERYDLLRRFEVRNIAAYNELGEKAITQRAKDLEMADEVVQVKLPYIVIVVDELADLMLTVGKDVETAITRLAQKSRAVGIHVILATQRPSTDVITGLIKANMPTRIAFKVASKVDSRVILDQNGADKLLGMGDMLYLPPRSSMIERAQGTYAADREVKRVVGFLRERYPQEFNDELVQLGSMPLLDSAEKDELYDQAVRLVLTEQRGSASLLQRAFSIGYTRASRLLDLMRSEGVVGAYKGSKASEVQVTIEEYEARVAAQGGRRDVPVGDYGDAFGDASGL
jgi:DNA segregation ATPase FtsK/SpoIIIE, S-DNA-T family